MHCKFFRGTTNEKSEQTGWRPTLPINLELPLLTDLYYSEAKVLRNLLFGIGACRLSH